MRINFLVYSNSKNLDVLKIFLSQLQECLIVDTPIIPKVTVLLDDLSSSYSLKASTFDLEFIQYKEGEGFSKNLLRARDSLGEYFIYMQDDFFLHSAIRCSQLIMFVETIKDSQFSLHRLIPTGHRRSKAYLSRFWNPSKISFRGGQYFLIDYLTSLPACMQPTVWSTETFMQMHEDVQILNLRDEWHSDYREFFKVNKIRGLASRELVFPYLAVTAVKRGKWNLLDSYYAEILIQILRRHKVNPLDRGVFLTSRRLSEPSGSFLKDIWRRLRYGL